MGVIIRVDGREQVFNPATKPETLLDFKKQVLNAYPQAPSIDWCSSIVKLDTYTIKVCFVVKHAQEPHVDLNNN
jgi:hypothetical protein